MKKKQKLSIMKVMRFICLVGIIFSLYNIAIWYFDNQKNASIKKELNDAVSYEGRDTNNDEVEHSEEKVDIITVDFEKLKNINDDTIAYLKVNGTDIDYVVVKGNDNSFYLKHNFYKDYNRSGWIFMDYHNKFDGTDKNVIIYGHNTLDGSMFGTLRRIITENWYLDKNNHIITLIGPNGPQLYQVFSTYSVKVEDYYIQTSFGSDNDFLTFANNLKARSFYNYDVSLDSDDSILTLSTCTSNGTKRMVLHAKKIKVDE